MKIIQINVVFKVGSTGKIVYDLHNEYLRLGLQSLIIYGRGKKYKESFVYKTSSNFLARLNKIISYITGYEFGGAFISTGRIIRIIHKEMPDIVHIHCINGNAFNIYRLIKYLKKNEINTVVTNHAEFFYTGSYSHIPDNSTQWYTGKIEYLKDAKKLSNSLFFNNTYKAIIKMKKAFEGFNNCVITSVSPWINDKAKKSFVLKDKEHYMVMNGIDLEVFQYRKNTDLIKQYKKEGYKILLHVTSGFDHPLKGGKYLIEIANKLIDERVQILVVGNINKGTVLPSNCVNIGAIKDQKLLADFYSLSDLVILTSKKETFSMVVAEALSCGTPVVGFKAGGPESIAISDYSSFVDYGDLESLVKIIMDNLNKNLSFNIENNPYSKIRMVEEYLNVYQALVNKKREEI